jgi:signal transduction histidine kinase
MNATITAFEQKGPDANVAISLIHDFRNPLATIRASSEMLVRSGLSEPQIRRIARNVHGASLEMQELLEAFVAHCRGAEQQPEVSDLDDLAANAVSRIADRAASHSVEITQDIPGGLKITVDRHRIHRVLVNLLVNALEAVSDGGAIQIYATPEPDAVLIQVRDTGPGIAPELHGRLFQPFATAGKADGIGLGLAFCRQAVIDHGGDMWAESSPYGTCFAFRLPTTAHAHAGASS